VIVSVLFEATVVVVIVNVAVVEPAGTVTEAGTVADGSLDDKVAVTDPPVATVPLRVTVAVDDVPPVTDVGLTFKELTHGTNMENDADSVVPLNVTETLAV